MPNPLNSGFNPNMSGMAQGANPLAGALGNINPQTIQNIMGMINRGANLKDIAVAVKKSGMTPQVAEQLLCMVSPKIRQIKEQMDYMKKSGMNQQAMFAQFAQQANVDPSQLNDTYNNLMKLMQ